MFVGVRTSVDFTLSTVDVEDGVESGNTSEVANISWLTLLKLVKEKILVSAA